MKKIKRTTILTLAAAFVGMTTLGLASCVKEEDVNSAVNSSVDPVKTQIATINGTLDELKATDKTLGGYIDTLEEKVAELETALDGTDTALEREISALKEEIAALKAKDTALDEAIDELEAALVTKSDNMEEWAQTTFYTIESANALKEEIQGTLEALDGKITALKERVEKNETDITGILERLERLEAENAIMKNCLTGNHVYDEITYEWQGNDCTAFHHCEHCDGAFAEAGTVLDLGGYKEATFEYELFEGQSWGKIEDAVIDGVDISIEELKERVTYVLTLGGRNIHVKLAKDASYEELYAIRRAIADHKDVADESVDLTLAGVEVLPDYDETDVTKITFGQDEYGLYFTEISTVTLPDAVELGEDSFYRSSVSKLIAPNLEVVGMNAFHQTNLTEVDLPKVKTTERFAFSTPTIKTVKLPSLTSLALDTFWAARNIERVELTAKGDITVGNDAFDPSYTENMDLVLAGDKAHQVSENTWTTKQPNGEEISFTFKSITFVGAIIDLETNTYYVSSAEGLYEWNEATKSDLTANLVLEDDIVLTGENNWTIIGSNDESYAGTLDGAGHSITGLHMEGKSTAAMISGIHSDGIVKDLTLIDVTFKAAALGDMSAMAGAITFSNYGTVKNCHVKGNSVISATAMHNQSNAGGIAYSNNGTASITGCSNEATVSSSYSAGIVAWNDGMVENCVNRGNVSGLEKAGGIVSYLVNSGSVKACINMGAVSGLDKVGGIVGEMSHDACIVACGNTGTVTVTVNQFSVFVGGLLGAQMDYDAPRVIGSWTVETQEYSDKTEVTEGKNGVGGEYFPECIIACYVGDAATVTAAIEAMNSAIASYGYKWVAGENGAYPTLSVLENS